MCRQQPDRRVPKRLGSSVATVTKVLQLLAKSKGIFSPILGRSLSCVSFVSEGLVKKCTWWSIYPSIMQMKVSKLSKKLPQQLRLKLLQLPQLLQLPSSGLFPTTRPCTRVRPSQLSLSSNQLVPCSLSGILKYSGVKTKPKGVYSKET